MHRWFFIMLLLPLSAYAELDVSMPSTLRLMDYNPYTGQPARGTMDVRLTNSSASSVTVALSVVCEQPPCRLRDGNQSLLLELDGNSDWTAQKGNTFAKKSVTIPAGSSIQQSLGFVIPAQQVVPMGLYSADLTLNIEQNFGIAFEQSKGKATPPPFTKQQQKLFIVESVVGQYADIALSLGGAADFNNSLALLSFGDAGKANTLSAFLAVRSNAPVRLEMSSQHNGALHHRDDATLTPIPYTLTVDGIPLNHSQTLTLPKAIPLTMQGRSVPLNLQLGKVAHPMAGVYRDYITITVVPF
jgi:spore coat protein U-like protein